MTTAEEFDPAGDNSHGIAAGTRDSIQQFLVFTIEFCRIDTGIQQTHSCQKSKCVALERGRGYVRASAITPAFEQRRKRRTRFASYGALNGLVERKGIALCVHIEKVKSKKVKGKRILLDNRIQVGQVPVLTVEIKTVTNDELRTDREAAEVWLRALLFTSVALQQHTQTDAPRAPPS